MKPAAIEDLRKQVQGPVLLPAEAGYDEARHVFNAMIDRRPALILRCTSAADVAAGIRFARQHNLPMTVRAGGHGVSGNAVCDNGLMLDLRPMKALRVDREKLQAVAQPGLLLGEFDQATTAQGLVVTAGVYTKTGIAGLTLGGGFGWLMGKYGLTCDNLTAAEMVTAEGKTVRASERENSDLLWGLRGGGGNFGVVTEFQYRLYPLEPMMGGLLIHPIERAREVLKYYREAIQQLPDELMVHAVLLNAPDGNPICALAVGYNGNPAKGEKALAPIRAFGPPLADTVTPLPYLQQQSMFDAGFLPGQCHYWKTGFMDSIPDEVVETTIEQFHRRPSTLTTIFFEHMHGAASRVPATATAFPHRFDHVNYSGYAIWKDRSETEANLKWVQEFWQPVKPYLSGRAYVNYLSQEGPGRVREAYGSNYQKLVALKDKYDPANFFRFNQNIPPSGWVNPAHSQGE